VSAEPVRRHGAAARASCPSARSHNHPLGQGNKRTAFEAADIFVFINGWDLALADRTAAADLIVDVITGAALEADLLTLFEASVAPKV
jgi:death-on-curing protein